jgi:predicted Zn-dependent protease
MSANIFKDLQDQIKGDYLDNPPVKRLGLQPGDLYGAANAATAALHSGDRDTAFRAFAHLVLLDPANADFHAGLAEAALAMEGYELALQSASVVVASRPDAPDGYYLSARACLGMGEHGLALEDLAEVERHATKPGQQSFLAAAQKMRVAISGSRSDG